MCGAVRCGALSPPLRPAELSDPSPDRRRGMREMKVAGRGGQGGESRSGEKGGRRGGMGGGGGANPRCWEGKKGLRAGGGAGQELEPRPGGTVPAAPAPGVRSGGWAENDGLCRLLSAPGAAAPQQREVGDGGGGGCGRGARSAAARSLVPRSSAANGSRALQQLHGPGSRARPGCAALRALPSPGTPRSFPWCRSPELCRAAWGEAPGCGHSSIP